MHTRHSQKPTPPNSAKEDKSPTPQPKVDSMYFYSKKVFFDKYFETPSPELLLEEEAERRAALKGN